MKGSCRRCPSFPQGAHRGAFWRPFEDGNEPARGGSEQANFSQGSPAQAPPKRVRILAFGGPGREAEVLAPYFDSLSARLSALGSSDVTGEFVTLQGDAEARLAEAMARNFRASVDLLIIVGETAIMDEDDLAPTVQRDDVAELGLGGFIAV